MFDGLKQTLGRFTNDVEGASEIDNQSESVESESDEIEADEENDDSTTDDQPGLAKKARTLAKGRVIIDEDALEQPLQDLEFALLRTDVELSVVEVLTDRIREELVGESRKVTEGKRSVIESALESALLDVLTVGHFDFDDYLGTIDPPIVIIFTGVNGVGKTTSIAKLARYLETEGYSVVLANGDTYRAGANEQLEEHARRLGMKVITHEQGGDPTAVIYDAVEYAESNAVDVVLGDTAGRLHTNQDLMNQLDKIDRVVNPDLTVFVDEAVAGQDAVRRAQDFNQTAEIDGTILTKADADASGGAAISIAQVTGKPILFLGTGQHYDDLEEFDPEELVQRLVSSE